MESDENLLNHMEINDYDNLPTMILSSYRFDSTSVLQVFPIEIIYIILDYLYTPMIEFEYSENTSTRHAKYHNGREYPYSIGSETYEGTIHESIMFRSVLVSHFLRLGKDRKNKVFFSNNCCIRILIYIRQFKRFIIHFLRNYCGYLTLELFQTGTFWCIG
jgi:hypothetical protein